MVDVPHSLRKTGLDKTRRNISVKIHFLSPQAIAAGAAFTNLFINQVIPTAETHPSANKRWWSIVANWEEGRGEENTLAQKPNSPWRSERSSAGTSEPQNHLCEEVHQRAWLDYQQVCPSVVDGPGLSSVSRGEASLFFWRSFEFRCLSHH